MAKKEVSGAKYLFLTLYLEKPFLFYELHLLKDKVDIIKNSILDCVILDISRATHHVNFVIILIGVRDLSSSYVIVKCGRNTENADPLTRSI
ncbi:MAG: hypothetical protein WB587_12585 [Nitrososphaeraceae archaeon]